ncbi:MAG: caspase family protein [Bacteroidota bacterium]
MKHLSLHTLLVFLLLGPSAMRAQEKVALIVAVGKYPAGSGWTEINAANDVPLVKNALLKQGYADGQIHVLENEDATKQGIIRAFQKQLIKRVKKGDLVYFHFSGHGQQVIDNNQDEFDGFDEALVPYDSPLEYVEGKYTGENLLRDEELGQLLDKVRAKLGPTGNLLAVIDACHSGTGTRGMSPARGTDRKMAPKNYRISTKGSASPDLNSMESSGEENLAPMVAFFGAAPNQLNFETRDENGRGVGSLSYAFSKKFSEADKDMTYQRLFDKIKLEMSAIAPRQQPQAEGLLNQQILGGDIVGKTTYFRVLRYKEEDPSLVIEGGWLQGIKEGSLIGFYENETMEHGSENPVFTGKVKRSNAIESIVHLDTVLARETALGMWAIVLENSYGDLKAALHCQFETEAYQVAFDKKINSSPVLEKSDDAELFIVEKDQQLQLLTKDDHLLNTIPTTFPASSAVSRMMEHIKSFIQAKFLRSLEVSSFEFPLEFEFVPYHFDRKNNVFKEEIPLAEKMDGAGTICFKVGDIFKLRLHNWGDKTAYFTLLDIQPDNRINILIPGPNETPADFSIAPGESKIIDTPFEIAPPIGTEVFKLIATEQPIDLSSIVSTRGKATRNASSNPFEKLFADTHLNDAVMTRGRRTMSMGSSKVNVFSQVFIIE